MLESTIRARQLCETHANLYTVISHETMHEHTLSGQRHLHETHANLWTVTSHETMHEHTTYQGKALI